MHEKYFWLINSLDNLQPMPLKENTSKKDEYNRKNFEEWLIIKTGKSYNNLQVV